MIILTKETVNRIATTFTENAILTGTVYFLWDCKNDDTNEHVYFIATELSTSTLRYNMFDIELTEDLTPINELDSVIDMRAGTWKYTAYEQNSSTNLDPTLSGGIVEYGRILVIGTTLPVTSEYDDNIKTNTYYEG